MLEKRSGLAAAGEAGERFRCLRISYVRRDPEAVLAEVTAPAYLALFSEERPHHQHLVDCRPNRLRDGAALRSRSTIVCTRRAYAIEPMFFFSILSVFLP
jgi:hypothetical protein